MPRKAKILFLCTGNSCRSQMAEGWARHLLGNDFEPSSAGVENHGLNPSAVRVMQEVGVDISSQRSKTLADLGDLRFDFVVTVCDRARESCPVFTGEVLQMHAGFDDPPLLAAAAGTAEEALSHYRRVRDEIRRFVESLPEQLAAEGAIRR
jgi:arsenate reductase